MAIRILPEYSALGIKKAGSPALPRLLHYLQSHLQARGGRLAVDHGCGQLRNLDQLMPHFSQLYLVDTAMQIEAKHDFYGSSLTIYEFIDGMRRQQECELSVLTAEQFEVSRLNAGTIFSINVLDVTPPHTRNRILRAIRDNLADDGVLAVVVPRNDSWTLKRCREAREYEDGFVFPRRDAFTFYRNWEGASLEALIAEHEFRIIEDMSSYRHGCMICGPAGTSRGGAH